jgi:hypothetical protein
MLDYPSHETRNEGVPGSTPGVGSINHAAHAPSAESRKPPVKRPGKADECRLQVVAEGLVFGFSRSERSFP